MQLSLAHLQSQEANTAYCILKIYQQVLKDIAENSSDPKYFENIKDSELMDYDSENDMSFTDIADYGGSESTTFRDEKKLI